MSAIDTFKTEDKFMLPVFNKEEISIERGDGVYVYDEAQKKYLDFTAGWGVTSIGHAHPVITEALTTQGSKIIQNPNSGLTYSPARAALLSVLKQVLPDHLTHVFFTNSGAEANDAAIKLARKVTRRTDVISTNGSFHGRTISTASATGQPKHRGRYHPLMPNYRFVPFDDAAELKNTLDGDVAAVIIEPIQGEGGVRIPAPGFLEKVGQYCRENGTLLIADEIQTGFCRTGPMFVTQALGVKPDFLTMAKGIAGGFPFGAFAVSKPVAENLEIGDHGGTYCGNPLGCAVAGAVIRYMIENKLWENTKIMGQIGFDTLQEIMEKHPETVADIRGKGLLLLMDFIDEDLATAVRRNCMAEGLLVTQTQQTGIRIFPALNITEEELASGLAILDKVVSNCSQSRQEKVPN